ncbi:hypothetical protein IWW50_006256, partial [Coemansia erecta]
MAEEAAVAAEISAVGPVIAIEGNQGHILEASPAFTDTSSLDSDGDKMPMEEMSEKDVVVQETEVETEQPV